MNKKELVLNKVLLIANFFMCFLIFQKLTDSIGLLTKESIQGITKDIIIFLVFFINIIICAYVNNYINSVDNFKYKINKIVNYFLMLCYLEVNYLNADKILYVNILTALLIFVAYTVCYFIVIKLFVPKQITYIAIIGLVGIEVISGLHLYVSLDRRDAEKTYKFANESNYEKYKELYYDAQAYVILDYSYDSVYVRDLVGEDTYYFSFDNQEDYNQFIDECTMGKDVLIPSLSYDGEFDDSNLSVTYLEAYYPKTNENMKYNGSYFFIIFSVWIIVVTLIGANREKKSINN